MKRTVQAGTAVCLATLAGAVIGALSGGDLDRAVLVGSAAVVGQCALALVWLRINRADE